MKKTIQIKTMDGRAKIPSYGSLFAAGADLYAIESDVVMPGETTLIKLGFAMALPPGYEAQVRPRSGLALKHGITVLNTPGTIDEDYRGEVGVILMNHSERPFHVEPGDRVAQMVVKQYEQFDFTIVGELSETVRGEGGFGSTGVQ